MNPDVSQITPSEPVRATDDGSNSSGGPSANVYSVDRQAFGSSTLSFPREASQTQVRINHRNNELNSDVLDRKWAYGITQMVYFSFK